MSGSPSQKLKTRALALLARREYTRAELQAKLFSAYPEQELEIPVLLDEFCQQGWLSDSRAASQLLHSQRSRYGSLRIVHNLRQKGVETSQIEQLLPELKSGELAAAQAIWQKKFGEVGVDPKQKARQIRFLLSRGFSLDIVRQVIKGVDDEM